MKPTVVCSPPSLATLKPQQGCSRAAASQQSRDAACQLPSLFADIHVCLPSQFKCTNTNRCIPGIFRCNGQDNCGDGEDEKDCREWGLLSVAGGGNAWLGGSSSILHQGRVFGYRFRCWLLSGWCCRWHGAFSFPLPCVEPLSAVTLLP